MKNFLYHLPVIGNWLFRIRAEGWNACEEMVVSRIKENYPDKYKDMIQNIIQ